MRVQAVRWSLAVGVTAVVIVGLMAAASGRAAVSVSAASGGTGREAIVSVNGLMCSMCARHLDRQLRSSLPWRTSQSTWRSRPPH